MAVKQDIGIGCAGKSRAGTLRDDWRDQGQEEGKRPPTYSKDAPTSRSSPPPAFVATAVKGKASLDIIYHESSASASSLQLRHQLPLHPAQIDSSLLTTGCWPHADSFPPLSESPALPPLNLRCRSPSMFHTFQSAVAATSPGAADGDAASRQARAGSRRISTSNACVECRRRKIRCDGSQPCGQCQWYQHPEACSYSKPAQRVVPSRKLVDKLAGQIEQYRSVLSRLFPSQNIEALVSLPREELLDLALSPPTASATSPSESIPLAKTSTNPQSDGPDSLDALEQAPPEEPEYDEARKHQDKIQGISDDVNGLSMSVDRISSYVGVSSMAACFKVIMRIAPLATPYIMHSAQETALPSRANSPPPELAMDSPEALPQMQRGQEMAECFFEKVHPFFPMVDERKFWTTYLYQHRADAPWLALLNMVFALGSLASSTADNEAHYTYFTRARYHLNLESFGSGNLEVLQALSMMSGYYMHYLNRPNEAHSVMGACLRMATALGLHREYTELRPRSNGSLTVQSLVPANSDSISAEMRRRIWWSLFCLDTWASTTTGRPSLGRMGASITVLPPGRIPEQAPALVRQSSPQQRERLKILPLVHNTEFCKIATMVQDRLVESPLLKFEELTQLDADIVGWYNDLPSMLKDLDENVLNFLRVPRLVMKWRYQNLRLVLHRPVLLLTALRRTSFAGLTAEEKLAVSKCRIIAGKTIEDISVECTPDLVSGWNGVWLMYQASMIPMLSLFSDTSNPEEIHKWREQVETALVFFERIKAYSISAKKSRDAVARLYEAYKVITNSSTESAPHRVPQMNPLSFTQFMPVGMSGIHNGAGVANVGTMDIGNNMGMQGTAGTSGVWTADSTGNMSNLSGFWDDMMWDTNLPDIQDQFNEYDYPPSGPLLMGGPPWNLPPP